MSRKLASRVFVVLCLVAVCGLALAGAWWIRGGPAGPFNVNGAATGELRLEPITFTTHLGDKAEAESGRFVVRESRGGPTSNLIELAFVRFPSTAAHPGTPVLFIPGGPGTSGIEVAKGAYFHLFMKLRENHDVIVLDERGVGHSIPDLSCGEELGLSVTSTNALEERFINAATRAARKCLDAYRREGVRVESYNDLESAADIDELRAALGYPKWSLFGYSHGTELAMILMRDYGTGVDRAVLAGPVAPDQAIKLPSSFDAVVGRMQGLLNRDPIMPSVMPDLARAIGTIHRRLGGAPVEVKIPTMDVVGSDDGVILTTVFELVAAFNPFLEVQVGGIHLEMLMAQEMGGEAWIRRVPSFYAAMQSGDFYRAGRLVRNFRHQAMPPGVLLTTNCATGYLPERMARAEAEGSTSLIEATPLVFGRRDTFCRALGLPPLEPAGPSPVSSGHPVLFLAGTLDAVTPLENLPELREWFPASHQIVVDAAVHRGLVGADTAPAILDFLSGADVEDQVIEREFLFTYPPDRTAELLDELRTGLSKGGIEGLKQSFAGKIRPDGSLLEPDPALRADLLNALGYELLAEKRLDDAVAVLGWAVELRPHLANAWDSFGEALAARGDTPEAIDAYERSIRLDMMNDNAYFRLRRLKGQD